MLWIFLPIFWLASAHAHLDCALNGHECTASSPKPCCDHEALCQLLSPSGLPKCLPNTWIGMSCDKNTDCAQMWRAECSRGECVCENDHRVKDGSCLAPLYSPCWNDGQCADQNSHCIDGECQCSPFFTPKNNTCVKKVQLGMECQSDDECAEVLPLTECSDKGKCVCQENYGPRNGKCAPLLNKFCSNEDCATINANCIGNLCQCRSGYIDWGSKCLPTVLGEACQTNSDCREMAFATCRENKCVCRKNFVQLDSKNCVRRLGLFCSTDEVCSIPNSVCVDNECQCSDNYASLSHQKCLPTKLRLGCQYREDCQKIPFAECIDGKCRCRANFIEFQETCAPLLGEFCWVSSQCMTENSECVDFKCQCRSNSVKWQDKCLPGLKEVPCSTNAHCQVITNAMCSGAGKCVCKSETMQVSKFACAPKIDKSCFGNEPCADVNAACTIGRCSCKLGYIFSKGKCVPESLNLPCYDDSECREIKYSSCIDRKCQCRKNYVQIDVLSCAALIGEYCSDSKNCAVKNSYCFNRICRCADFFSQLSNDKCVSDRLELECEPDGSCVDAASTCEKNECVCLKNHVAVNRTCLPLLFERCNASGSCAVANSLCIDNFCRCDWRYAAQGNSFCLPAKLKSSCSSDSDCAAIGDSECEKNQCVCRENFASVKGICRPIVYDCPENNCVVKENFCRNNASCIDYKNRYCLENACVCLPNHVLIHGICEPLLDGFCSRNRDCVTINALCIDRKCQCKDSFYPHGNNSCIISTLGMKCLTDLHCRSMDNLVCSKENICSCFGNGIALNNFVCSRLIGEDCLGNNHCKVLDSHCVKNVCKCKKNFTAVSPGQCVESSAVPDCFERSNCGDPLHSDCSDEGKCICKRNHFSASDSCLPLLGGFCWRQGQCWANNSACINHSCQCRPGFLRAASNICVLK